MRKNKNHRLEKLGFQLIDLQKRRLEIEKKERKITETMIKLMEKRQKKEVILEEVNRIIRLIQQTFLKVDAGKIFKLLPLKKFIQVVEVRVGELEKVIGREKLENIAEKKEGKKFLRVERLKKSVRP